MLGIVRIISFTILAQAYAQELQASQTADKLTERAFNVQSLDRGDLENTVFGKVAPVLAVSPPALLPGHASAQVMEVRELPPRPAPFVMYKAEKPKLPANKPGTDDLRFGTKENSYDKLMQSNSRLKDLTDANKNNCIRKNCGSEMGKFAEESLVDVNIPIVALISLLVGSVATLAMRRFRYSPSQLNVAEEAFLA